MPLKTWLNTQMRFPLFLQIFEFINSTVHRLIKPKLISRTKVFFLKITPLRKLFCIRYFALNSLDEKLERYLDFDQGYYVELGANDGVNQSNTLYFEFFRNWSGILIEPYIPNYIELRRNRSSLNSFFNVACVGPTYQSEIIDLVYSNLMTSTLSIKSEVESPLDHAESGSKYWGGKTFVFSAPAATLNSVLLKEAAPKVIDLLSLDTEGVELEILKGVDHSMYRFRYICVESRQIVELRTYLEDHGYDFVKALTSRDYLFMNSI
jgi:FkbM family methyltransferase